MYTLDANIFVRDLDTREPQHAECHALLDELQAQALPIIVPVLTWEPIWEELRDALAAQPPCPQHPEHPQVRTVVQGVINDLLSIDEGGILVRSHRTQHEDFIEARRFAAWWDHLTAHGSASLHPGDPNNPHRWRSRVVGAMLLAGLPNRLRLIHGDTIELLR